MNKHLFIVHRCVVCGELQTECYVSSCDPAEKWDKAVSVMPCPNGKPNILHATYAPGLTTCIPLVELHKCNEVVHGLARFQGVVIVCSNGPLDILKGMVLQQFKLTDRDTEEM